MEDDRDGLLKEKAEGYIRLNAKRRKLEAEESRAKAEVEELMGLQGIRSYATPRGTLSIQQVSLEEYDYNHLALLIPPTLLQFASKPVVDPRILEVMVKRGDMKAEEIQPALRLKTYSRLIIEAKCKK